MNTVKKILLVHGDATTSRTLTLLLAGAGYYVRSFAQPDAALEAARSEWYDLSLVADPLPEMSSFGFIEALKKRQPGLSVLLLVKELELPSVIKGIRLAVTDVLAPDGDWELVLERVNAILQPGRPSPSVEVTPEQLAEVEAILSKAAGGGAGAAANPGAGDGGAPGERRGGLVRLAQERDGLRGTVERLAREKTVLEAELRKQLALQNDAARQRTELAEIRSEREIVAAAQTAVDEKARAVAEAREALAKERAALAAERAEGRSQGDVQRLNEADALNDERQAIETRRSDLRAEEVRLREMAAKVKQGQVRLEIDRRQFQEDMDLLREQETNLRAYEQRLRAMGAAAEVERVQGAAPRAVRSAFRDDATLDAGWTRLNRAMDLFQAERRSFTGEKLVLTEELARLKKKEEALRQREQSLVTREAQVMARESQPAASRVEPPLERPAQHVLFTHAPFRIARDIFAGNRG
jgi:DNA-binding response OmpR family regulator